jgi:hypothetical protein
VKLATVGEVANEFHLMRARPEFANIGPIFGDSVQTA